MLLLQTRIDNTHIPPLPPSLLTSANGTSCVSREWGKGLPWLLAKEMWRKAVLGTSLTTSHWRKGGREGGREGRREGGGKGGRGEMLWMEGRSEGGRERGRQG